MKLLYDSLLFVNNRYTAQIVGYVFMQNHIHLIIFFPQENKLSDYMRDFKKYTSTHIRKIIGKNEGSAAIEPLRHNSGKQKFKVWMDRFDDVVIKSARILQVKLHYIHYNPVNKGLVNKPEDYQHSSAAYYFKGSDPIIPILHYSELS
jgi:putative transposase